MYFRIRGCARSRSVNAATGVLLAAAILIAMLPAAALAAPMRLGDEVPDAVPDQTGAFSAGWSHLSLDLEGALTGERSVHDYFKLGYTFSPKVAAALTYGKHDLSGGFGLITPLFDQRDAAESYELDLRMNLMTVAPVAAVPATSQAWAAGSSFGIGLSGTQYQISAGSVGQTAALLKAYLVYSTDLSEELRAHTVFSSARLSGDGQSGSQNRVGAGLDYTLIKGERPLVLMADGVLDIYNFRQPAFNTSRVSRFDIGLRYRLAKDWYASLGWVTANDSENDKSGSGIFASLNFVDEPPPPCSVLPPAPPAEAAPPAPQALVEADKLVAHAAQPPLMQVSAPAENAAAPAEPVENVRVVSSAEQSAEKSPSSAPAASSVAVPKLPSDDGVVIPAFPDLPQLTPAGATMVRAGYEAIAKPESTDRSALFTRAPGVAESMKSVSALINETLHTSAEQDAQKAGVLAASVGPALASDLPADPAVEAESTGHGSPAEGETVTSESDSEPSEQGSKSAEKA